MTGLLIISLLIINAVERKQPSKARVWYYIYDNVPWNFGYAIAEEEDIIEVEPNRGESAAVVRKIQFLSNFTQVVPVSYGYLENGYVNDLLDLKREITAQDIVTGQEIPLGQLSDQKILSSYKENDKEVYFLGQYSKNCNWDGYCITNVYNSDGTLYGICEYNFRDGESQACKSLYNTGTDTEWICVDREYNGDESYGESIHYTFKYDVRKDFTDKDIEYNDILYIDSFLEEINATTRSYYRGKMSNGKYNDKSGEAFLITYFEPNTIEDINIPAIKTLYRGKFVDGKYFEEKYDSWYITRGINIPYMYYKGGFFDGDVQHKDEDKEVFINNLTHEQIDGYLNEYGLSEYSNQFITEYEN